MEELVWRSEVFQNLSTGCAAVMEMAIVDLERGKVCSLLRLLSALLPKAVPGSISRIPLVLK